MIVAPFASVPQDRWNAVVHGSPDGWPFALTQWRDVILAVEEWQLEDYAFACVEGDAVSVVVPLQLDRRSGALGMTGWGGCGPIVASQLSDRERDEIQKTALIEIDRVARETGARSLRFSIPPVTQRSIENISGSHSFAFAGYNDLPVRRR